MTVELLTRLNPKGNSYIAEMQNTGRVGTADSIAHNNRMRVAARAKACPKCRGRRKRKVPEVDELTGATVKVWRWCERCQGSGVLADTGGMSSTRVAKRSVDSLTSQDIAAMLAGLPEHKVNAAMFKIAGDDQYQHWLEVHLRDNVIAPQMGPRTNASQVEWLAWLAVIEFRMVQGSRIKAEHCASRINVSTRTWYNVWAARHKANVDRLDSWVEEVDAAMRGYMDEMVA